VIVRDIVNDCKIESNEETSHHVYFSQTVFKIMVVIVGGIVNDRKTLKSHLN